MATVRGSGTGASKPKVGLVPMAKMKLKVKFPKAKAKVAVAKPKKAAKKKGDTGPVKIGKKLRDGINARNKFPQ